MNIFIMFFYKGDPDENKDVIGRMKLNNAK